MTDDSLLWQRVRVGDADAYGRLFERHADAILNYCFRRVGDWATAEDLLSIVFLEGWRRRDKQLPPGKVLPWLYGIAGNVVRNQRRAQRRYAAALRRLREAEPEADAVERADERLDEERQMKRVLALVGRLPRREQEVLRLVGAQLRGRGARTRHPRRDGAVASLACAGAAAGTRAGLRT